MKNPKPGDLLRVTSLSGWVEILDWIKVAAPRSGVIVPSGRICYDKLWLVVGTFQRGHDGLTYLYLLSEQGFHGWSSMLYALERVAE